MNTFVKEIRVENETIALLIKEQVPCVEYHNQLIYHIWILNQHLTLLSKPSYLKEFAELSNFLWKGTQFQIIENISHYQHCYEKQVELERQHPGDLFPYRLTDYKIFDVSVMHEPLLEEGYLHYFVFNCSTGLPYRVVCPFPYTSLSTLVRYQILPLKIIG